MWEQVWEWVFPRQCVGCGKSDKYICDSCLSSVSRVEAICPVCTKRAIGGAVHPRCKTKNAMDGLVAVFRYEGVVRKAIGQIKFKYKYKIGEELVASMIRIIEVNKGLEYFDFLNFLSERPVPVPVPVHWLRRNLRGFNQSSVLADSLSKRLGIKAKDILVRNKWTGRQVGKSRENRLSNIKDAFAINPKFHNSRYMIPKSVLLIDDVWTTGATMRECAKVLKRAGVERVWGITVAR